MDNDSPLALYTLDELWDEITRRTDAAILCVQKDRTADEESHHFCYHGSIATALGLAHGYGDVLSRLFAKDQEHLKGV